MNYSTFINKDFRNRPQPERHTPLRWLLLGISCAVLGVVLASSGTESSLESDEIDVIDTLNTVTSQADLDLTDNQLTRIQLQLPKNHQPSIEPQQTTATQSQATTGQKLHILRVKPGDSLSSLFDKADISPDQVLELIQLGSATRPLTRLHPGDILKAESNDKGQLLALQYQIDPLQYLQVLRGAQGLSAELRRHEIETRHAHASGSIDSSLFAASQEAGLSQALTMELANIFGWDIDFAQDIRSGDRFTVIYEEIYKNGEKLQDGDIIAAEFVNRGESYRALRYSNPTTGETGYYSPDGLSLRKAFLRSPVKFSRISSKFSSKRYHPLLHKIRSHKGVDYAARRGTPVRASGDGKIIYRGNKGGYGKVVIIKHGNRYSTLYAHLSNFNRKARLGQKVRQGQIVGYVGATGLASGPHLHYEFRVNGVHRNPLTVKFPSTSPIPSRHRDNFELTTNGYISQLNVLSKNTLALNQE